jgi:serine/threonine protein kinase
MPPEQFRFGSVNKTADVYSFGIVLFEMLTGRHPFAAWLGLTDVCKWEQLQHTVMPDLSDPALPPHVRTTLARCLVKAFNRRYSDFGPIRAVLADEYRAVTKASPPPLAVRPLDATELGLKATGLFELGFPEEAADSLVQILDLEATQEELFSCYERVTSLLEFFSLNRPGWNTGVGAVLLCALAPGRASVVEPVAGFPEALLLLESTIKLNPSNRSAREMKARLFLIAGRYEDALTAFREAIASSPNDENWKARLLALPLHHSHLWEHELSTKHKAQARSNVSACYRLASELGHSAHNTPSPLCASVVKVSKRAPAKPTSGYILPLSGGTSELRSRETR